MEVLFKNFVFSSFLKIIVLILIMVRVLSLVNLFKRRDAESSAVAVSAYDDKLLVLNCKLELLELLINGTD